MVAETSGRWTTHSFVHHFREVASSNGLVRCNVHGSRPFVGPAIIRKTNRRDTHLSAIGSKMGMHHVHRECPLLALSGHSHTSHLMLLPGGKADMASQLGR